MNTPAPEPVRPSFTRGGGAGTLRWGSLGIYAIGWVWLLLGLLAASMVVESAVCVAGLALMFVVARAAGPAARLQAVGGVAAIAGGLVWAAGAIVVSRVEPDNAGWTTSAASLFLLPALLAVWVREREAAWLGPAGFALGLVPVFAGAVLTGGLLGPISGGLTVAWFAIGLLLLIAGSVPFALVAIWSRRVARPGAAIILVGAGAYILLGVTSQAFVLDLTAALAGTLYGAGWIWLGVDELRRLEPDVGPGAGAT